MASIPSSMLLFIRLLLVCLMIPFFTINAISTSRLHHSSLFLRSSSLKSYSNLQTFRCESSYEKNQELRSELLFRSDFSEHQNKVDFLRRIWEMINNFERIKEDYYWKYKTDNSIDDRERFFIRNIEVSYVENSHPKYHLFEIISSSWAETLSKL